MIELEYVKAGDYLIPALVMETEETPLGKYGLMRLRHMTESDNYLYTLLLTRGELQSHLRETETAALSYVESFMEQVLKGNPIPEELKDSDPLAWAGQMENLRAQAEELVTRELIFTEPSPQQQRLNAIRACMSETAEPELTELDAQLPKEVLISLEREIAETPF